MNYQQREEWINRKIQSSNGLPTRMAEINREANAVGVGNSYVPPVMRGHKYQRRWLWGEDGKHSLYWVPADWPSKFATESPNASEPPPPRRRRRRSKYDTSKFLAITCSPQAHQFIKDKARRTGRPMADIADELIRDYVAKTCGQRLPSGDKMQSSELGIRTTPKFGPDVIVPVKAAEATEAAPSRPSAKAAPAVTPKDVQPAIATNFDPVSLCQSHIAAAGPVVAGWSGADRPARGQTARLAKDWLQKYMGKKCGGPVRSLLVFEAAKQAGYKRKIIHDAADLIGVKKEKKLNQGVSHWYWSL